MASVAVLLRFVFWVAVVAKADHCQLAMAVAELFWDVLCKLTMVGAEIVAWLV